MKRQVCFLVTCTLAWAAVCRAEPTTTVFDQTGILDGALPRDAFYGSDTNTWASDQPGGLPYAGNYAAHFTPYPHNDARNELLAIGATSAFYSPTHPFTWANGFSVEAWIKPTDETVAAGDNNAVFATRFYGVHVLRSLGLSLVTYGRKDWETPGGLLVKDAWSMINVTYSEDGQTATFYVNGEKKATVVDAGQSGAMVQNWNYFCIGHRSSNSGAEKLNPYHGYIDELALFHSVLTDAQVLVHYNARNADYGAAVLADEPSGYWNFNKKRRPGPLPTGLVLVVR